MNYAIKTRFLEYFKREFNHTLNVIEVQIIEKRYKDRTYLINELNHNFKTINQIAIENSVSYTTIIGWVLKNGLNELLKKTQIKRHMGPGSLTDNQKSRVRTMSKIKRSNYVEFGYFH